MKLIFVDIETTGLAPSCHLPIEIAIKVVDTYTGQVYESYEQVIKISERDYNNASPMALKCNGFTYEELQRGKPIEIVSTSIMDIFHKHKLTYRNSKFIACNAAFDKLFFCKIIQEHVQKAHSFPFYWLDFPSIHFGIIINQKIKPATYFGTEESYLNISSIPVAKDKIAAMHYLPPEETPHRAMNGVNHLLLLYSNVVGFSKPT